MKRTGAKAKQTGTKGQKNIVKAKAAPVRTPARAGAKAGFLKVPTGLQKTLTAKAEADKSFKGSNWQKYCINKLKEIAGN